MDRPDSPGSVTASPLGLLWGRKGARLLAGDGAIILILLALIPVTVLKLGTAGGESAVVEVEVQGRRTLSLPRSESGFREVSGPLGLTRIEIREGRVRVVSSPCPLKICQRAGWIDSAGEIIVCLPNEVVVRLPGRADGDLDALSR